MIQLSLSNEAATQAFAQALASCPALRNACLELRGNLGAGKTTLVRHLLRALGVQGRIKSPTYALLETYDLAQDEQTFSGAHFDFYRLQSVSEWEGAGFRDLFAADGLKLVEWPEKVQDLMANGQLVAGFVGDVAIKMEAIDGDESARRMALAAQTELGKRLLCELAGVWPAKELA